MMRACSRSNSTANSHLVWNATMPRPCWGPGPDRQLRLPEVEPAGDRQEPRGLRGFAEVEPAGDRQEPRGLLGFVEQGAQDDPVVGADGGGPIGAAGGVLVEGTGAPDVGAGAVDLGVIDGRDLVAVPDPTRGGGDQASQGLSDARLVPGAVLGEGFQGLPGGGLLQGQDRLGDGVFLDVERHGGDPLGEAVEAVAGEGPSEGVEQGLPDGPGELSFGHDASPVSGPVGLGTTCQVPTRRRCFSIRYARSVLVEFFVETTV